MLISVTRPSKNVRPEASSFNELTVQGGARDDTWTKTGPKSEPQPQTLHA
jgi:hypothetical protein